MKLFDVWNAVYSVPNQPAAWTTLTSLKKPPKVAYRLFKYGAQLGAEFDVIEKQRTKLLYEAAGVSEGSPVDIQPGTPEFSQFANGFNEFLAGDSDLEPVGITMDALIAALDIVGNALSEQDLAAVKPFFKVKTAEKPAE
ncbi:MAG: hypothetical protein NUV34_06940 [Sulfuricaulis sp.]|nr:hypothetical protein [Sulfuricaulis sp.]